MFHLLKTCSSFLFSMERQGLKTEDHFSLLYIILNSLVGFVMFGWWDVNLNNIWINVVEQSRRDQIGLRRQNIFMNINITLFAGSGSAEVAFFLLVCADRCLCLSFLTQICISVLVLACWNLTLRTRLDLYHKVQLNSVMAYNTGKSCQKCQKFHIIFCLFRKLCCFFSLFLLALCPEMYFKW